MDSSDNNLLRPRDRDSHDLSVQLTRYSVVDSMLLSLAGLQEGDSTIPLPSTFDPKFPHPTLLPEDDPYVDAPRPKTQQTSHSHSASYSAYPPTNTSIDDTASRYTAYHNQARANAPGSGSRKADNSERARQTNSFPPASAHESSKDDSEDMLFRSRTAKHAKKNSNGSAVEKGLGNGSNHKSSFSHARNRSASFDQSVRDGGLKSTSKRAPRPPPLQSPEAAISDYDFEAAPTPTIPAGPRRQEESAAAALPPVTPRKTAPSRQGSVKSSRTIRKNKANTQPAVNTQDASIRESARQFVSASNNLRNAQNAAVNSTSAAPSPTVGGTRKSVPSPVAQPAVKEKQGFFRRVFGGSSKQPKEEETVQRAPTSAQPERPRTQPTPQFSTSSTQFGGSSQQYSTSSYKSASRPPTQDPHAGARKGDGISQHQTLRKSSSSFFRRRKRSVDHKNDIIPPVPPLQLPKQATHPANNSKINLMPGFRGSEDYSLRNVMAPYLNTEHAKMNSGPIAKLSIPESRETGSSHSSQSRAITDEPYVSSPVEIKAPSLPETSNSKSQSVPVPMPSRPAPIPSESLQMPAVLERPLLSPISDRSFVTAESGRSYSTPTVTQLNDDEFTISTEALSQSSQPRKNPRVWIRPSSFEEERATPSKEIEDVRVTNNKPQSDHVDFNTDLSTENTASDAWDMTVSLPENMDASAIALSIFVGDEKYVSNAAAATWLGKDSEHASTVRELYMQEYAWSGTDILVAFRDLCSTLILRAESQVLDRLIASFAKHWCHCNPSHEFRSQDVVHTIVFAVLMLNTDLHIAESRMTKAQFIKNTLPTIRNVGAMTRPSVDLNQRSEQEEPLRDSAGDDENNWDTKIEKTLKIFYNMIKADPLPLNRGIQKQDTLQVNKCPRRTPSVISRAPSDNISYRSNRFAALKAKSRSRMTFGSSRTSLDDDGSIWSPVRTMNSMSMETLGVRHWGTAPIGFASSLSRTIGGDADSLNFDGRNAPLLDNEDLELHGPPWAKEGILQHMLFIGTSGKRKERRPMECFAVVSKGSMRLFSFGGSNSTTKNNPLRNIRQHKSKNSTSSSLTGQVVGGGNWLDNAHELGTFSLQQSWADRDSRSSGNKFTWYLHLPTNEIHAFQVNSAELREEWTWTVNYWAARLSRQPLDSGVSNQEYGWSERFQNAQTEGKHIPIWEWQAPAFSLQSSQLMEVDQKAALDAYLERLDEEFVNHAALKPKSNVHPKAFTNWSTKASYLAQETFKYKTWGNALEKAGIRKIEVETKKEETANLLEKETSESDK